MEQRQVISKHHISAVFLRLTAVCVFLIPVVNVFAEAANNQNSVPVIAIASVRNFGRRKEDAYLASAFKTQVASHLVNKYNCYVVTRSHMVDVGIESSIDNIVNIQNKIQPAKIIPADYVFSARFLNMKKNLIKGFASYIDISKSGSSPSQETPFSTSTIYDVPDAFANYIAKTIHLKKRIPVNKSVSAQPLKHVYAVLPLMRLDVPYEKAVKKQHEDNLETVIETAIKQASDIAAIVDRQQISQALQALKVQGFTERNHQTGISVARLVAATRLIMGTIATDQNGLRVDLNLIDPQTSVIIGACWGNSVEHTQLEATVKELTTELICNSTLNPSLPESTAEQRLKEAEFYLGEDYGCVYDRAGHPYYDISDAVAVQHNTEAAYLLQKDNSWIAYRAARIMSDLLLIHHLLRYGAFPSSITKRTAAVIDVILKNVTSDELKGKYVYTNVKSQDQREEAVPLLLRAEAFMFLGDFKQALKLSKQHLSQHPDIERERALWITAKCYLALDQPEMADHFSQQITSRYHNSEEITELLSEIAGKLGNKKRQYKIVRKMVLSGSKGVNEKNWDLYINNVIAYEGARNAAEELQNWIEKKWNSAMYPWKAYPDAMFTQACCFDALGQKTRAARRLKDVISSIDNNYGSRKPKGLQNCYNQALTMLHRIETNVGIVPELWKTPADIRPFPENYKIYVIPIKEPPQSLIKTAAKKVGKFFDTGVCILPPLLLSPNLGSVKGEYWRELPAYWKGMLTAATIPDDAIMVSFVTMDRVQYRGGWSLNIGNPLLISLPPLYQWRPEEKLARQIASAFHYSYTDKHGQTVFPYYVLNLDSCDYPPCLFVDRGRLASMSLRFSICPKCQEEYKKVDFDKVHRDLMRYLKKSGTKIVDPSEIEFTIVNPDDKQEAKKNK